MRAQNLIGVFLDDDLGAGDFFAHDAVNLPSGHVMRVYRELHTALRSLRFSDADRSQRRHGVDAARNGFIVHALRIFFQEVTRHYAAFVRGDGRELHASVSVAAGKDSGIGRAAKIVVHLDAAAIEFHLSFGQIKSANGGNASSGIEHKVGRQFARLARCGNRDHEARGGTLHRLHAGLEDKFGAQLACEIYNGLH